MPAVQPTAASTSLVSVLRAVTVMAIDVVGGLCVCSLPLPACGTFSDGWRVYAMPRSNGTLLLCKVQPV